MSTKIEWCELRHALEFRKGMLVGAICDENTAYRNRAYKVAIEEVDLCLELMDNIEKKNA